MAEGLGAESLDFKYSKRGGLLSLVMQADKTKGRFYWWPPDKAARDWWPSDMVTMIGGLRCRA